MAFCGCCYGNLRMNIEKEKCFLGRLVFRFLFFRSWLNLISRFNE